MTTVNPANLTDQIMISVYLKKGTHDSGMTLQQYADGVIAGDHPVLDHDEFYTHFGVDDVNINTMLTWAAHSNLTISDMHQGAGVVKLIGTVLQWNSLFNITVIAVTDTDRTYYTHNNLLTIPAEIINVVESIAGLDNKGTFKHHAVTLKPDAVSNAAAIPLTPAQVAQAYGFPAGDGYGGCLGLIELGGGFTDQNLISTFETIQGLSYAPNVTFFSVDSAVNTPGLSSDSGNNSIEVMLDIAVASGIVPQAKTVVYTAPNTYQGFIDCFTSAINDKTNSPSVLSCSWGAIETSYGVYAVSMNSAFQSAAVLGISIFTASGDSGSYDYNGFSYVKSVDFPASSPYITGVGGTTLTLSGSSISSEVGWNSNGGGSGGGLSTVYTLLPSWQTGLSYKNYSSGTTANLTVRGVPDVAANADPSSGYKFYVGTDNGLVGPIGGTSAAAPLWAGYICLLTVLTGKRFGFINSFLYSNTSVCRDIISGNNQVSAIGAASGYSATVGWDAVTGLGSPNGSNMVRLVNTGAVYPTNNFGFRPATGPVWPRTTSGVRTD